MAQVTFTAAAADIETNKTALAATDSSLTAANYSAVADLLALLAKRHDLAAPLLALSDNAKDELIRG